jgi:hypothetical protein
MEYDIEESEANRLLALAHQDVDKALEYWLKEKMENDSDDSIYQTTDASDDSEDWEDDPFEEEEPFEKEETPEEMMIQLINLGYSREAAEVALIAADNDLFSAVQMLSASGVSQTSEPIQETGEELVERVVTESDDKRTGSIHQSDTEEILKAVWAVHADEIADWLLDFYDTEYNVLIFFVKCCEHTDKVQDQGTTIELSLDIFRGDADKQTLAQYGIFTTYTEAMAQAKYKENLQKDYTLAREAAEGLRPMSGGEFKNSWESQGPQETNNDQTNLRKMLEMKLKDVSARAARARLLGAPERRVQRFVDAAIVYITSKARASGYQIVRKSKLHRQRSEGGGTTHTPKIFRQKTN